MKLHLLTILIISGVLENSATSAPAPVIKAGETKTGAPGTNAKVTSRKKDGAILFDFVIPRGTPGIQGPQGPTGPQGPPGTAADTSRSIYIPAGSLTYFGTGLTVEQFGLRLANTASAKPTFVIPQPADWDKSTAVTITLHFSVPETTSSNSVVNWRLLAGTMNPNLPDADKDTGWDVLDYETSEDAASLVIPALPGRWNTTKTQSWTTKFSSIYNTWHFGSAVTTNNDMSGDPLWRFSFQRGSAASNGESHAGPLTINAVTVNYTAK